MLNFRTGVDYVAMSVIVDLLNNLIIQQESSILQELQSKYADADITWVNIRLLKNRIYFFMRWIGIEDYCYFETENGHLIIKINDSIKSYVKANFKDDIDL